MDQKKFDEGLAVRKEVLGSDYVNNVINKMTEFNRPMQELVTQYCWGEIWKRPGLSRKTRKPAKPGHDYRFKPPPRVKAACAGSPQ